MKTPIFHKIKYDLKGHWRSQKVFFVFKNQHFLRGNSCSPSLSSPSLTLSLCLSIFSLSLILLLSFSFFHHPYIGRISTLCLSIFSLSLVLLLSFSFFHTSPYPTPTSALYPPYASPSFLSLLVLLHSFFLTLTYVLMDNFLSLFILVPAPLWQLICTNILFRYKFAFHFIVWQLIYYI